jgi:hypothetical protein
MKDDEGQIIPLYLINLFIQQVNSGGNNFQSLKLLVLR